MRLIFLLGAFVWAPLFLSGAQARPKCADGGEYDHKNNITLNLISNSARNHFAYVEFNNKHTLFNTGYIGLHLAYMYATVCMLYNIIIHISSTVFYCTTAFVDLIYKKILGIIFFNKTHTLDIITDYI